MPTVNALVDEFLAKQDLVVYTKDHHPRDHVSFQENHPDGLWPPHCVQDTSGADFHADLNVAGPIFYKGFLSEKDSYSGFGGHIEAHEGATSLEGYLKENAVEEVTVVGLALDYCVKSTAIDAQKLGFPTTVRLAGTKAVNVRTGDDDKAVAEMKSQGITVK